MPLRTLMDHWLGELYPTNDVDPLKMCFKCMDDIFSLHIMIENFIARNFNASNLDGIR